MRTVEIQTQRRRRLAGVTLGDLERQMDERWDELKRAWDSGASSAEEERIYDAYLQVLDDWQFKQRSAEGGA